MTEYAKTLNNKDLLDYINDLKLAYYFGTPKVSDDEYDEIVEMLPSNIKPKTGIDVPETFKDKVKLPYWMSSLDKAKSKSGIIERFLNKYNGEYVVSEKLDGLSGLYIVKDTSHKLFTRGTGDKGRNVSYLLKYIKLPELPVGVYRGELIMSKSSFKKYNTIHPEAKNARTTAVGLVNHKNPNPTDLSLIEFVPYEIIKNSDPQDSPSIQFSIMKSTIWSKVFKGSDLSDNKLESLTIQRIENSDYEIDGLVVTQNSSYERSNGQDPSYSIAYKIVKTGVETVVNEVKWKISKDNYIKPVVHFNPIQIDGHTIKQASAHNAAYVFNNGIGGGAVIKVTRSNDVIPYVVDVIKGTDAEMPDCEWEWNDTIKDAIAVEKTSSAHLQTIVYFFKEIDCQFFGEKMIEKCIHAGIYDIPAIIDCTIEEFKHIPGIEQKSASRIYNNIRLALDNCSEEALMSGSNTFGRTMGKKRIKLFIDAFPNWYDETPTRENLLNIEGYQSKTVDCVLDGIPKFKKFLHILPAPYNKLSFYRKEPPTTINNGVMKDQKIVCTGFRSKELESWIVKNGGEIVSGVSKKTTILLTKEITDTTKTQKAKDLDIPIMLVKDFCVKYNIKN